MKKKVSIEKSKFISQRERARSIKMSSKSIVCVQLIVLLTNHFATTQSQNCDLLSPIKLSPLDMTLPFKMEPFSDFEFQFDKKSPFKISHKTNVLVELSDKNTDKSPTFSGGGICGDSDCVFKVSISPTFYEQRFCIIAFSAAFMCVHFLGFVIFWQKEI